MGFFTNKRAVSVALSTMIITAGVIAAGIAVLYWTYSWGNVADQQYSQTVNSNSLAMQENIGFEYVNYANPQLTIYIINSGQSNYMTLRSVYLWDTGNNLKGTYQNLILYLTSTIGQPSPTPLPTNYDLTRGIEVYFTINIGQLSSGYYTVRLVTGSGRNFDYTFSV
jgi:hypothetical protein